MEGELVRSYEFRVSNAHEYCPLEETLGVFTHNLNNNEILT